MRFQTALVTFLVLVGSPLALHAQQPAQAAALPVEKMRDLITENVEMIIAAQREDGSWEYTDSKYNVGYSALCTLALRHSALTEAVVPAQKGLAWIVQQPPEPRTYTAGLVELLLFEVGGGSQYQNLVAQYAMMTIYSQLDNPLCKGQWGYNLVVPPARPGEPWPKPEHDARGDNSNSQYGILALYFAGKSGFQVPLETWRRVKELFETTQRADGAYSYLHPLYIKSHPEVEQSRWTFSMTCVGAISLYLADEALTSQSHQQCKMNPDNPKVLKGMQWVGQNTPSRAGGYTWYACERLGILTGRSEFAGKDWLDAGARAILASPRTLESGNEISNAAFEVLFLARALEPIRINKLQREGDWNNDPYDLKHLTEYVTEKYQNPTQWRIVTLQASVDHLLRVPVLYITGHDALPLAPEEKAKLKEYVARGGTVFAMACCGSKTFDKAFRDLCAELWPDTPLAPVPKNHPLFLYPKKNAAPPNVLGIALDNGQGRLAVIYSPADFCCRWHTGGKPAESAYLFGINVIYYVDVVAAGQGAVKAGHGTVNTSAPKPPVPQPR